MIQLRQPNEMPDNLATIAMMKMQIEGMPAEKAKAMAEYAKELRRKFPHMKPVRLQRKVCEKFHIKLV